MFHAEAIASSRHGVRLPATMLIIDLYAPYFRTNPGQRKLDQLEEELQQLCELNHPNILSMYGFHRRPIQDMVSQGWRLVIVTEPLPRTTLFDMIEDAGEMNIRRAMPLFRKIAGGLEYLHSQQVVHRGEA